MAVALLVNRWTDGLDLGRCMDVVAAAYNELAAGSALWGQPAVGCPRHVEGLSAAQSSRLEVSMARRGLATLLAALLAGGLGLFALLPLALIAPIWSRPDSWPDCSWSPAPSDRRRAL